MADVIPFPNPNMAESQRLGILLAGGPAWNGNGHINDEAAALGSAEDWAWSSISYLKANISGPPAGSIVVSSASVALVLGYVEDLAGRLGIIDPPGGEAA